MTKKKKVFKVNFEPIYFISPEFDLDIARKHKKKTENKQNMGKKKALFEGFFFL